MTAEPLARIKTEQLSVDVERTKPISDFSLCHVIVAVPGETEVEVWPAGDRPTREQIWETINALDAAVDLNNDQIYAVADAVMALLSAQSPTGESLCAQCGQRPEADSTGLCDECWGGA